MNGVPRVSVGIPVFNGERYLGEALRSIQGQTVSDLEIIVSDNGSTDATEEICRAEARADRRIVYLRYDTNRGGAWNYMNVARNASGPFFTWMASDDIKCPRFAEACLDAFGSPSDVVLTCPGTSLIDEAGAHIEDLHDGSLGVDAPRPWMRVRNLLRSQASHLMYGLIRTDVLRGTRGVLPMVGDDMVLLVELACRGRMVRAQGREFLQRRHAAQLSQHGHEQVKWHSPRGQVRFAFPQTRLDVELYRAVWRSPIPWSEQARCWGQVGPSWVIPRWRGVARDIATAIGV